MSYVIYMVDLFIVSQRLPRPKNAPYYVIGVQELSV